MIYAKYDAMDVAEYVLHYCETVLNSPISNLKLQKILYYIQGAYLRDNGEPLFDNYIEAWDYGPVVPDVYYSYNRFIGNPIIGIEPQQNDLFEEEEIQLIQCVVDQKINIDVWTLVKQTHEEDPWDINFKKGYNNEIPIDKIRDWFINN